MMAVLKSHTHSPEGSSRNRPSAVKKASAKEIQRSTWTKLFVQFIGRCLAISWTILGLTLAVIFGYLAAHIQTVTTPAGDGPSSSIGNTTSASECGKGWATYPGSNSCYLFSHVMDDQEARMSSWEAASNFCRIRDANLVCVDDVREHNFVSLNADSAGGYWTALNDRELEGHFLCEGSQSAGILPRPWQGYPAYQPDEFSSGSEDCVAMSGPFQWSWQECSIPVQSVLCELRHVNFSSDSSYMSHRNGCPDGWRKPYPLKDSCYKLISSENGWDFDSAESECRSLHPNASILSVDSLLENEVLAFEFGFGKTWIDLHLQKGSKRWSKRALPKDKPSLKPTFTNFILSDRDLAEDLSTRADESKRGGDDVCAVMVQSNWNDVMCSLNLYFVCERAKSSFANEGS